MRSNDPLVGSGCSERQMGDMTCASSSVLPAGTQSGGRPWPCTAAAAAAVSGGCCHAEVALELVARGGRNRACRLFTLAARLLTHIGSSRRGGPSFLQPLPAAATTGSTGSSLLPLHPRRRCSAVQAPSSRCSDEHWPKGLPRALIARLEGMFRDGRRSSSTGCVVNRLA